MASVDGVSPCESISLRPFNEIAHSEAVNATDFFAFQSLVNSLVARLPSDIRHVCNAASLSRRASIHRPTCRGGLLLSFNATTYMV
ncbi:hypothetical protein NA66_102685 [Burkholderia pyrrocinia]|uniref:Uncharacterized protein n=1 Tax=Burkholderia pyrrocinia TaxID=60550 RepID=A0A318I8X2_BURPY|nr:hypothetical protein NA66_102685 [Burkholderia pyrrocinia]SFW83750.1 hypothetical protein SAMN03159384_05809 [Burkholderia sp. NFACC33-1]SFY44740.1 hypothetical protein SAMN03159408_05940 [Burkholderia sp. NFPP32]